VQINKLNEIKKVPKAAAGRTIKILDISKLRKLSQYD